MAQARLLARYQVSLTAALLAPLASDYDDDRPPRPRPKANMAASTASTTSTATAPNIDGMLLLEAPFARAPHDELKRQLRSQQRLVERDLTACSTTLAVLARSAQSNGHIAEDKMQMVDVAVGDTSFAGDASFMTEGARADESIMTMGDIDEDGEADNEEKAAKEKSSDLEKSLDIMLGRLKGLKRKVGESQRCISRVMC